MAGGTGELTLSGSNSFTGDLTVAGGTVVLASATAAEPAVTVTGTVDIAAGSTLTIEIDDEPFAHVGRTITVLRAGRITGEFTDVNTTASGIRAVAAYVDGTLTVTLATGLIYVGSS